MDIKKTARSIFNNFFIIFTCVIFIMFAYFRFLEYDYMPISNIAGAFVVAALTSLAEIILHSKKEQRKLEVLIRSVIHLVVIIMIVLSIAAYMRWFLWSNPTELLTFIGLIIGVYAMVAVILYYRTKKLTDKMNEKLKERYKE